MPFCESFAPIIDERCRVLILGSMPSQISLAKQQYYANPQNQFWKIVFSVLGIPLPDSYKERRLILLEQGIGLWDVLASCIREGSSDSTIREEVVNDFTVILQEYPGIELLAFNGSKAKASWNKHMLTRMPCEVELAQLPSSSSAYPKPLDQKIESWQIIKRCIKGGCHL